jgi:Immunity protein 50
MTLRSDFKGAELVSNVFGYWPSFHDAEVLRICLQRTTTYEDGPDLLADIHVFEIGDQVGPDGTLVLTHHTLVSFRFSGIDDLLVRGFGNQNAIAGLSILDIRARQLELLRFEVSFEGAFGTSTNFLCRDVLSTTSSLGSLSVISRRRWLANKALHEPSGRSGALKARPVADTVQNSTRQVIGGAQLDAEGWDAFRRPRDHHKPERQLTGWPLRGDSRGDPFEGE